MRGFKRDHYDTDVRYRLGIFKDKEKRSFISTVKPLHGVDQHEILYGVDVGPRRHEVYEAANGYCYWCQDFTPETEGDACHISNKAGERCDCLGNYRWGHGFNTPMGKPNCHFIHDHAERL